jgi:hypothetical protein
MGKLAVVKHLGCSAHRKHGHRLSKVTTGSNQKRMCTWETNVDEKSIHFSYLLRHVMVQSAHPLMSPTLFGPSTLLQKAIYCDERNQSKS